MKKEELISRVRAYTGVGIEWDLAEEIEALTKADLVNWLMAKEPEYVSIVSPPPAPPEEQTEAASAAQPAASVPSDAIDKRTNRTPEAVKQASRIMYYRGVKVRSVIDQIMSGRIYKDITLENGLGYKLTMKEFEDDITYEDHATAGK